MAKLDHITIDNTSYEIVPEIAPLYASNTSYAAGDCVIKDAVLYRFTSPHAAWAAWSGLDVEEIAVADELINLRNRNSDLSEIKATKTFNNPSMGAGYAAQLMSSLPTADTDKTPYNLRKTPFDSTLEDGNIVGVSVAWNQLINADSASDLYSPNATIAASNGTVTLTSSAASGNTVRFGKKNGITSVVGHKVLLSGTATPSVAGGLRFYNGTSWAVGENTTAGTSVSFSVIFDVGTNGFPQDTPFAFSPSANMSNDTIVWKYPQMFDLTQMLGTTIADYVYSLETATAGSGVAWLKEHFPNQFGGAYQAYNAGEIKSISGLAAHKSVGFNQWDEETELGYYNTSGVYVSRDNGICSKRDKPIRIMPNTVYCLTVNYGSILTSGVCFYDADDKFISFEAVYSNDPTFTTPNGARYMRFYLNRAYGTVYKNNICINLSKPTGTPKNGDYVPYESHTYALDSTKTLRGLYKLDANNKLYADGDVYKADGTIQRRYGVVDLGTLSWSYRSQNNLFYTNMTPYGFRLVSTGTGGSYICKKYNQHNVGYPNMVNGDISNISSGLDGSKAMILVCDTSYTSAQDFTTAMSGVYLVYELATPTTETAEPYGNPQVINPDGTESYVYTDGAFELPVGHNTFYLENLRKKLEQLVKQSKDAYKSFVTETVTDTAVASFTDGADDVPVKSLIVDVNPVQDLHGYSNPWPGGGGKNKLPVSVNTVTSDGVTYTVNKDSAGNVISISTSGTATSSNSYFTFASGISLSAGQYVLSGCPSGGATNTYIIYLSNKPGMEAWVDTGASASATLASDVSEMNFTIRITAGVNANGLVFKPMIRLSSVSDATFAPYSNICPISGWTGANVSVTDINQWDEQWELGSINSVGQKADASNQIRSKNYIPVCPNTVYFQTAGTTPGDVVSYFYDAEHNHIPYTGMGAYNGGANPGNGVITTPSNARYMLFRCATGYGTTYNHDVSISYPSTDHYYHAYKGGVYSVDWTTEAGTVYGGTLDVTNGVLMVTDGYVDLGTLTWTLEDENFFKASLTGAITPIPGGNEAALCSNYERHLGGTFAQWTQDKTFWFSSANISTLPTIAIRDTAYTSAAAFKTAMSGVQLVYELATPQTVQLTPTEVTTLLLNNNIFADTGNVNFLTYRADTKAYIDGHINA